MEAKRAFTCFAFKLGESFVRFIFSMAKSSLERSWFGDSSRWEFVTMVRLELAARERCGRSTEYV